MCPDAVWTRRKGTCDEDQEEGRCSPSEAGRPPAKEWRATGEHLKTHWSVEDGKEAK